MNTTLVSACLAVCSITLAGGTTAQPNNAAVIALGLDGPRNSSSDRTVIFTWPKPELAGPLPPWGPAPRCPVRSVPIMVAKPPGSR